jgi:hypothetical protein
MAVVKTGCTMVVLSMAKDVYGKVTGCSIVVLSMANMCMAR